MKVCLLPINLKLKYIYLSRKETFVLLTGIVLWFYLFILLLQRRNGSSTTDSEKDVHKIQYTRRPSPDLGPTMIHAQEQDVGKPTNSTLQCNDTFSVDLMPPGTFPLTGLASFPGSGNTLVRHMIESATGYATGSVYHIKHLEKDFIGEMRKVIEGETIVFKMHDYWRGLTNKADGAISIQRAILIMRNPYQALLDEFRRLGFGKAGVVDESRFRSEAWFMYMNDTFKFSRWLKLSRNLFDICHHSDSNSPCKSLLILYYENLENNLEDELRRIMKFLDVAVDEHRLSCVIASANGVFHRPQLVISSDPFTHEHHRRIDEDLKIFHQWLEEEGLPQPPPSFKFNNLPVL